MSEKLLNNYESNNSIEQSNENTITSFDNTEKIIKDNYLRNESNEGARELAINQINESNNLRESLENQVLNETRENLDKEALIQEAKTILYEKLGINENQTKNSRTENFLKGIVDVLVIDNYDLAIEIYETNGKVVIDALKALMSWEGIKQMAGAIGESFMSLFTGNAYEKGKAVGELGLVTTGIGIASVVGKKAVKVGMREISKLRVNKERLVSSPEMKGVIADTNKKIEDIIPKKEVDFEKMLVEDIARLGDKDRIDAGRFYIQRKLTPEQENAIIKAHEVGKDRPGAGIYNYNQAEISEKSRILKEAGFSVEERRLLMDKGVCGKEVGINILPENIRNLDLELVNYSQQQLDGIKIRLGLDSKATISDIDLAYRLKLQNTLERYKELSNINLSRFELEILENLRRSGDLNPKRTLENEILKLEIMKDRGELLVVSAMSDEVVRTGVKYNHFANLDKIGYTDFRNPLGTKEGNFQYRIDRNYNELRGVTDKVMGVEGLDPTYLSLVISKNDIHKLNQYGDNFMVFGVDELHGRATITMNDSMLAGRFNGKSLDTQLIHYSTETLIKAKAIYNIDEKLGFPIFNRMRGEAFKENQRMRFFYENMKPFIEVQVYGKTSDRVKNSLSVDAIMKKFNN